METWLRRSPRSHKVDARDAVLRAVRRLGLMPLVNRLSNGRFWLIKRISSYRGASDLDAVYTARYFALRQQKATSSAAVVAKCLTAQFAPSTVVDVGCGTGAYVQEMERLGARAHGYEGSSHAIASAVVSPDRIEIQDLREPLVDPRSHDLVVCLEVAEHLPAESADQLVDSLVTLGDRVVFSAAAPGQGGRDHVNEKPSQYWIALFEQHGFELRVEATARLRTRLDHEGASWWLGKNLLVLERVFRVVDNTVALHVPSESPADSHPSRLVSISG